MFVSTYDETRSHKSLSQGILEEEADDFQMDTETLMSALPPTPTGPIVYDINSDRPPITEITGAWAAVADEATLMTAAGMEEVKSHGRSLPKDFKGLATPEMNPMVSYSWQ